VKTIIYIIIAGFMLTMIACSKNNFDTGIMGTIEQGSGDCMPIIDTTNRVYEKYSGQVYFIRKTDLDNLGNGDFQELKNNSISKKIRKGKLSADLPSDTYVVMTDDLYYYTPENTICITSGQILQKDFKFWICTSF
jgi:hypothetical protein